MSFAEIKRKIPELTRKQRRELTDVLSEAARADRAGWAEELDRRNTRMDGGEKHTLEEFRRRHSELQMKRR